MQIIKIKKSLIDSTISEMFFQLFFFLFFSSYCLGQNPQILNELNTVIESSTIYDAAKEKRIDSLKSQLSDLDNRHMERRFALRRALYKEYRVFKYDSAFSYARRIRDLAMQIGDKTLIADAEIDMGDVCVAAGMYKEALDFLGAIDTTEISSSYKSIYYGLLGRCYSEMAEYSNLPYFSEDYNRLAAGYRKKALSFTEEGTFFNSFLRAFIKSREGHLTEATSDFENILKKHQLNLRDDALVNYVLGDLYVQQNNRDLAITHFSRAAIADIKTSAKETLAIIRLANLLFMEDDTESASVLIQKANDDALFFGARQRKIQVGAILPLIEQEVVQKIERQKKHLYILTIMISLLLLFVLVLAVITYRQNTKLRRAGNTIKEAHEKLKEINEQLIKMNNQLQEANKIKEEYIGFFFTQDADIFEKFREFKLKIENDLKENDLERLRYNVRHCNLKREKEKLLENFDEAFSRLFPDFIEEFNSLLTPEHKITLKKGQLLNKELRIFALMRLGVKHNEIIARILGYSVNSIYAYKTQIRNKSIVDKKKFDEKLLQITNIKL